ncbi:branched-chain amino acid ABC transporter permease [Nonomuraea cavernae]|uniref:Branched-chain amino acid ABC transporter permease n=1 Tax=Nonomuraea cavernae TaxID=2045107 RepID=A0A917ZG27_9ACTN|nr:branched-chain amino acid ABC transporter permease [Nonomuraea cavernae]MCA2186434.1 branched-chain amino acid ABC transporter permease [Nonomuraea cavernae]GGO82715.1 branched-chain amino acid ABC transporter permease [Nonomuraea cavernae]
MTLIYAGLSLGAVYALVAIGYNIVFVASRSFNFAQAQLMMIGAFVAYTGHVTLGLPAIVVVALAMVVVMLVAAILERVAVRPVADHQTQLITTLGFGTVLTGLAQLIWGSQPLDVPFFGAKEAMTLFGGRLYSFELGLIVLSVVLVAVIHLYNRRMMSGLAIVAMSQDDEAAVLRGINVRKLAFAAFAITGLLAGLMGFFIGPKTFAVATLGSALALKGFVALAIGGFGSFYGGLVGGFVVGLVEEHAARYLGSEFSNLSVFLILILVLMLRPTGLFGQTQERTV